jgi:hypothetical protein
VLEAEKIPFEKITLVFKCSINVTITDQYNRVISDDGINEIPNAEILSSSKQKLFYLPADLIYNVDIKAFEAGSFTLSIVYPITSNTASLNVFDNVSTTEKTHATLVIAPNERNPLKIDYDGDGTIE